MQYIDESLLLKLELSTVRGWMQRPPIDEVYPSSKLLLLFMTLSNCITASKIVVLMPPGTFQATTREIIASSVCCLGNICTYTSYKMENGFLFSFSFFLQFYVITYSIFKAYKEGQFDVVELMLNNQFKAFSINFTNQPVKIGLEEIEKI